jgi:hypothetical protein
VTELTLRDCEQISDITMLKNVVKLNISGCPKIPSLSGLTSLKELCLRPETNKTVNITSGLETFAQLSSLTLGQCAAKCKKLLFSELAKAPLKELRFEECSVTVDLSACLIPLQVLQTLEFIRCEGNITIPGIPSLGKVQIQKCVVPKLSIEGPNSQFPVYTVEVIKCHKLEEVNIARTVSFIKYYNYSDVEIEGRENIKELLYIEMPREEIRKLTRK